MPINEAIQRAIQRLQQSTDPQDQQASLELETLLRDLDQTAQAAKSVHFFLG
jgi:hypothetical protein